MSPRRGVPMLAPSTVRADSGEVLPAGVLPERPRADASGTGPYGLTLGMQVMHELSPEEFAALKADIEINGITVPVVLTQHDVVIDGHHRLRAADELGLDSDEIPWHVQQVDSEAAARDLAYRLNINRRHLTREQKRQALADSLRADPALSDRQHAARVGADHKTVGVVRREIESTGEIPQSTQRRSADGRERPASQPARRPAPEPAAEVIEGTVHDLPEPTPAVEPEGIHPGVKAWVEADDALALGVWNHNLLKAVVKAGDVALFDGAEIGAKAKDNAWEAYEHQSLARHAQYLAAKAARGGHLRAVQ